MDFNFIQNCPAPTPVKLKIIYNKFLPQRFPLGEGQVAVGPGLVDGDGLALQQTTLVGENVCLFIFFSRRFISN